MSIGWHNSYKTVTFLGRGTKFCNLLDSCHTSYYNQLMQQIEVMITELLWDNWNSDHITKHQLTPADVELALTDKDAVFLRAKQERVMVLGRSNNRLLAIVLNQQVGTEQFYVITARDMSKKERAFYRAQKGSANE